MIYVYPTVKISFVDALPHPLHRMHFAFYNAGMHLAISVGSRVLCAFLGNSYLQRDVEPNYNTTLSTNKNMRLVDGNWDANACFAKFDAAQFYSHVLPSS